MTGIRPPIAHCRNCGTAVVHRIPDDGDTKVRAVCPSCQTVHYENPLNVVGTIPTWGKQSEQVLLCKRNIHPRKGYWTLPAGFMELGETTAHGAVRETIEEAGANIQLHELFTLMNVVRVGQVHFYYRATLTDLSFNPGHETQEVCMFTEETIPWDELAFTTVKTTLRHYFEDLRSGAFQLHCKDID